MHRHPVATPTLRPHDNCPAPARSARGQRIPGMKGIPRQSRSSWASSSDTRERRTYDRHNGTLSLEKVPGAAAGVRAGGLGLQAAGLVTGLTKSFCHTAHTGNREQVRAHRHEPNSRRADFKKKKKPQSHRLRSHCGVFLWPIFTK